MDRRCRPIRGRHFGGTIFQVRRHPRVSGNSAYNQSPGTAQRRPGVFIEMAFIAVFAVHMGGHRRRMPKSGNKSMIGKRLWWRLISECMWMLIGSTERVLKQPAFRQRPKSNEVKS